MRPTLSAHLRSLQQPGYVCVLGKRGRGIDLGAVGLAFTATDLGPILVHHGEQSEALSQRSNRLTFSRFTGKATIVWSHQRVHVLRCQPPDAPGRHLEGVSFELTCKSAETALRLHVRLPPGGCGFPRSPLSLKLRASPFVFLVLFQPQAGHVVFKLPRRLLLAHPAFVFLASFS